MEDINTRKLIKHFRRTRSQLALQVLMVNHQAAIKLAASYGPTNILDFDDKVQVGNEILLKLIKRGGYDLRRRGKFNSYLISLVRQRIIDEIRRIMKKHKGEPIKTVEISDYYVSEEDPSEFIEAEEHKALLIEGIQKLPYTEQVVMGCLLSGMKQTEIAKQCGSTNSRISQIVNVATKKLRKYIVS